MFKSILFILALMCLSLNALAQEAAPAPKTDAAELIAEAKAKCEALVGTTIVAKLARHQCLLKIDVIVNEQRVKAAGADAIEVKEELKRQRALLETITRSLKALEAKAQKAEAAAPKPTAPQGQPMVMGGMPPAAPFAIIEAPGQLNAFTRDHSSLTSMHVIAGIGYTAKRFLDQDVLNARVIVFKNGRSLAVVDPSGPCLQNPLTPGCSTEFYADLDRDGVPEVYKGIDPSVMDAVYIATKPGDRLEFKYLSATANMVAVPGLPPQRLWGYPVRTQFPPVLKMGRFQMAAGAASQY